MKRRRFTAKLSGIVSAVLIAGQIAAQVSPVLPDEAKHWVMGVHLLAETLKGWRAWYRNPDGTPAEVPWR